jgi:hypothetical protein
MRNKILISLVTYLFSCWTPLPAIILEISTIQDVTQHVDDGALVVFDIDNTLVECSQTLGSDQWFCAQIKQLEERGWTHQQALAHVLEMWTKIQHHTTLRPVETHTAQIVRDLQQAGYPVIALTTRATNVAEATKKNLYALGIDLRPTAPLKENVILKHDGEESDYQEGILFTNNGHKGKALWAYLHRAGIEPRKIVFINDKHSHLLPVEEVADLKGVEFVGLRYGGADTRVRNFRKEIADIQHEFYGKILTDEAAEAIWLSRQAAKKSNHIQ